MSKTNPRVLVATDFSPGSDAALRGLGAKIQMTLPMGPVHAEICDLATKLKVDLLTIPLTPGRSDREAA